MQTLKTAVIVVLLLVVFYGVYEMLNRPPTAPPPAVAELPELAQPEIDFGNPDEGNAFDQVISVPSDTASSSPAVSMTIPTPQVPPPAAYYGPIPSSGSAAAQQAESAVSPLATQLPQSVGRDEPAVPPPSMPTAPPPAAAAPAATATFPPPPTARGPAATGSVYAESMPSADLGAGYPLVQTNPFVHEDVVATPSDVRAGGRQIGGRAYEQALKIARQQIAEGDYPAALSTLSVWYKSPDLTAEEHRELLNLLDPLAGRVVYSRQHLIERPYHVRRNETLADIARAYNVPWQLLQKINGIENPDVLLPGSELKVVRGPFRADVDLQAQELTVFLNQLYAGRFPITVGRDPEPVLGEFHVRDKQRDKAYFAMDGRTIPADSPANPFGRVWLDLGREVCIHGSPAGGTEWQRGCISLSPRDAEDVYSILSVGSRVRILR